MRLQTIRAVCLLLAAVSWIGTDVTGAQPLQPRSFEVASVRLATERPPRPTRSYTDQRVDLTYISLRVLLLRAFGIEQPSRLSAPDWVAGVNVDIRAVIPEGSTREHIPEMLKTLLVERFGLRAHAEPRLTDVYALVAGNGELRMQEVQAVDELEMALPSNPSDRPLRDETRNGIEGRLRYVSTERGAITITERSRYERIRTERGTEVIDAARLNMEQLAELLTFTVDRPVVDRTGLTGTFRLRVELPPPTFANAGNPAGTPAVAPVAASAFSAVESLGLRLERQRVPLDTIVVDQINRTPTDN